MNDRLAAGPEFVESRERVDADPSLKFDRAALPEIIVAFNRRLIETRLAAIFSLQLHAKLHRYFYVIVISFLECVD